MTIAELRARAAQLEAENLYPHTEYFEIQKKFSIPFACLVFGLIGLGLGATNRRDGKLASFVIGVTVIIIYWAMLYLGQALNRGHVIPPWLAAWSPNILLGIAGIWLLIWRNRAADQPMGFPRRFRRFIEAPPPAADDATSQEVRPRFSRLSATAGTIRHAVPLPRILDRYVTHLYIRLFTLAAIALASMFYLVALLDNIERVFRGTATWEMLAQYLWFATPQNIYYVLPLAVLLAGLVTIGLLTTNSELIVMKACGISLYRVALPIFAAALVIGGVLFTLDQTVLGPSNRRAEALRHVMRGGSPQTFDVLNRQWIAGGDGKIYRYDYFDPRQRLLMGLSVFEFGKDMQTLKRRVFVSRAAYAGTGDDESDVWQGEGGWIREFNDAGETLSFTPFTARQLALEPAAYFGTQQPDARFMNYAQLRGYIVQLQASGFSVTDQRVALERKVAFPFVAIVMTLIAVPFAVTTGRRGAMYGIGVGILLAIGYWVTISIFAALGASGLMPPALAAWAPNLLFSAGAVYLLLTVRT